MVARGTEDDRSSVPLRLDLLRHGEALAADAGGDAVRRLSPAGREAIERVAERFVSEGWRPSAIWTSPLVRARETAAILARACHGLSIGIMEALTPDHDPEDALAELGAHGPRGHVVLVGHQPLLGRLARHLTGREVSLPAGALVALDVGAGWRRGGATIRFEIRPER